MKVSGSRKGSVPIKTISLDSDNIIPQEPNFDDENEYLIEVKRKHTMQLVRQMANGK